MSELQGIERIHAGMCSNGAHRGNSLPRPSMGPSQSDGTAGTSMGMEKQTTASAALGATTLGPMGNIAPRPTRRHDLLVGIMGAVLCRCDFAN
jgi:hypothetical protein